MVRRLCRATLLLLCPALFAAACGGGDTPSSPSTPGAPFSQTDLRAGTGAEAVAGRTLTVQYTGWLYAPTQPEQKGQQFDSSAGWIERLATNLFSTVG